MSDGSIKVLSEATLAAYLRGELSVAARADVERLMDEEPQWLCVLAVLAEDFGRRSELRKTNTSAGVTVDDFLRSQAQRLHAGEKLGRFEILHPLGRGGMGTVYAAEDTALGRTVALKVLNTGGEDQRTKLLIEARALARINDPHVITIHDVGVDGDRVYLAMERIEGQTLLEWRQDQVRTVAEVLEVFAAAGRGLIAAHDAGLVHRDVKPTNIMVARSGEVVMVDFGLAVDHDASQATQPGLQSRAIAGTPAYMAPEQRHELGDQPTSDEFSFCVALFESLMGFLPAAVTAAAGRRASFPPAQGHIPRQVHKALRRGLQRDPDKRFGSIRDLLRALRGGKGRRTAGMVAACTTLCLGGLAALPGVQEAIEHCTGADAAFAPTWNDRRAELVHTSLAAEGSTWAVSTADRAVDELDAYAERWKIVYTEVCKTNGGDDELELAMRCLEGRRRVVEVTLDVLEDVRQEGPVHARPALDRLPPLDGCIDGTMDEGPHSAEEQDVLLQIARASTLYDSAAFDDAQQQARSALTRAHQLAHAGLEARARLVLANVYEGTGRFDPAVEQLRFALAAATVARDDATVTTALHRLVWVVGYREAQHAEGRKIAERAEAWSVRTGRPYRAEFSRKISLGWIALETAELDEAERNFRDAEALATTRLEQRDAARSDVASALNGLGATLRAQGKPSLAESAYLKATNVLDAHLGPEHPQLIPLLKGRAAALRDLAQFEESLQLFEKARHILAARENDLAGVAELDVQLAALYTNVERLDEAVVVATRALESFVRVDAGQTAMAADAIGVRGEALLQLGRGDEALKDLHRAHVLDIEIFGAEHPRVAADSSGLASGYAMLGKLAEAEAHQRHSIEILSASLGADHPRVAAGQLNLAFFLRERGAHEEALELYVEATPHADARVKPILLLDQAETLLEIDRALAAIPVIESAKALLADFPESTGLYGDAVFLLAKTQYRAGDRKAAQSALSEALSILAKTEDPYLFEQATLWGKRMRLNVSTTESP